MFQVPRLFLMNVVSMESVTDFVMAVNAVQHPLPFLSGEQRVNEVLMTMHARVLRHAPVARLDLNRLVKVLQRECQRMKEAVVPLHDPFADRVMREMAIVADGDMLVTRVLPRVVMSLHDMAVRTGGGIVAEIGRPLAVAKGEGADADENPKRNRQCCRQPACCLLKSLLSSAALRA